MAVIKHPEETRTAFLEKARTSSLTIRAIARSMNIPEGTAIRWWAKVSGGVPRFSDSGVGAHGRGGKHSPGALPKKHRTSGFNGVGPGVLNRPEPSPAASTLALAPTAKDAPSSADLCAYPYGDKPPFARCGRPAHKGYCEEHRALCYRKGTALNAKRADAMAARA
jgi:hypothetical protein